MHHSWAEEGRHSRAEEAGRTSRLGIWRPFSKKIENAQRPLLKMPVERMVQFTTVSGRLIEFDTNCRSGKIHCWAKVVDFRQLTERCGHNLVERAKKEKERREGKKQWPIKLQNRVGNGLVLVDRYTSFFCGCVETNGCCGVGIVSVLIFCRLHP